ncbi:MAG: 6-carboxytetrahydropterin synthase [Candidatus Zixiibacteriota bacterium]
MYLTVSKRFEFSASLRLERADLSPFDNDAYFGSNRGGRYGTGFNVVVTLIFHGPVDPATGMLINVTTIKERFKSIVDGRYDHKFLNSDTPPFNQIPPTLENLAQQFLAEAIPLFSDQTGKPVACHIEAPPASGATAYATGEVERDCWVLFSAARRTFSPHVSDEENRALFGIASSPLGHGHNYRLRVTIGDSFDPARGLISACRVVRASLGAIRGKLDHKNLNLEVPELKGQPITTETLARFCFHQLSSSLPVRRVQLFEMDDLFAEYRADGRASLGAMTGFHAAHRLHSPLLDDRANLQTYGKCNNPSGHGHWYQVEGTVTSKIDERTGTVADLNVLLASMRAAIDPWSDRHLDLEIADFRDKPSTSENMVGILWNRLEATARPELSRLRLWETPNNRFTLRRTDLNVK